MRKLLLQWKALRLRLRIYRLRVLTRVSPECKSFCDSLIASDMMFDDIEGEAVLTIQVTTTELRHFMSYMGGLHNSMAHKHNELIRAYVAAIRDTNTTEKMGIRREPSADPH